MGNAAFVDLLHKLFVWPGCRVHWLKMVWAAAFLAGLLLSPKLWVSSRTYPLCPVSDLLPDIPYPLDYVWYGALLVLLAAIAFPWTWLRLHAFLFLPQILLTVFVVLAGLLSLWDQSRWQPWFYQYLCIGIALACYPWRNAEAQPEQRDAALNACRVIIAATYFWSGLQKFNADFIERIYPWLLKPVFALLPENLQAFVLDGAPAAPFLEAGIGVALLIPRLRPFAVAAAAGMHVLLLGCLGPWGLDHNSVVWPWNIAMPIMTALLFLRTEPVSLTALVWPRHWLHRLALLFFAILPALNFMGLWDAYLSASLYSGSTPQGFIFVRTPVYHRVPEPLRAFLFEVDETQYRLNLYEWSMREMNVPPYPARRVFQAIARRYLAYAHDPSEVLLDYWSRPDWLTGERQLRQYFGAELAK
jgi:uncharacterized membrane protein YphA (DoxX/SURF4 family)